MRKIFIAAAASLFAMNPVQACTNFVGMNIASYAGGVYNLSQLWNPVGSGKRLKVTEIVFAPVAWDQVPLCVPIANASTPGQLELKCARAGDIVMDTAPRTVLEPGAAKCKDLGDTSAGAGEFRMQGVIPSSQTGIRPFYEFWPRQTENDRAYHFNPPIELPPGTGLTVRGAQPNLIVVTSWQWTETDQ